jgi:16S rRNA (adenine1518-N6/adenine1519-N6)-dimethyltransferase
MLESCKTTVIRTLMNKYGFKLSKNFGQNLLTDGNIVKKIADAAELCADDTVVEIGPGFGAMTVELSRRADKVIAVEIDRKMIPVLNEVTEGAENIEIINEDFMKFDTQRVPGRFKLVGNLPYYITTPLIMKMLENPVKPELMVFMVQREVAERIVASPGGRVYGAISVMAQYHSRVRYAMDVSREVFLPKPQVDSAVIVLTPGIFEGTQPKDENMFFTVVRAGFGQRRKMLRNALEVIGLSREALGSAFERANIDPMRRAETLGTEEFIILANAISEAGETAPAMESL